MEPVQKDCHISLQRFDSWLNQALAGHLYIKIRKRPFTAEIYKGSYFLNDELQKLPREKIKATFWGLMHKYKRIQIEKDLYILTDQEEELWDKYPA